MKKQIVSLLLVFVLAWLSGLYEAGHSRTIVADIPVDIVAESAPLEEELPAADLEVSPVVTVFFLSVAALGFIQSVRVSRFDHLTPVFYEGGYLLGFYKYR